MLVTPTVGCPPCRSAAGSELGDAAKVAVVGGRGGGLEELDGADACRLNFTPYIRHHWWASPHPLPDRAEPAAGPDAERVRAATRRWDGASPFRSPPIRDPMEVSERLPGSSLLTGAVQEANSEIQQHGSGGRWWWWWGDTELDRCLRHRSCRQHRAWPGGGGGEARRRASPAGCALLGGFPL